MKVSFFAWQDAAISIALVHSNAKAALGKSSELQSYNLEWQGQLNGSKLVYTVEWKVLLYLCDKVLQYRKYRNRLYISCPRPILHLVNN